MDSIGQILRQEREQKGLQLSDAHNATKITPQNLAALEEDRFEVFPNRVYARAFLRDYANFLGLDSGPLLEQYEMQWGQPGQQKSQTPPPTTKSSDRNASAVLGLAVLIILLMVALAFYKPILSAIQHMTQPQQAVVPPKPKPDVTPKPPIKPPTPPPAPQPVEGVTLQATALQPTWMRVIVDGVQVYQDTMPAGYRKTWYAKRVILFRAGKAGGVRLTLDGTALPPLGTSARPYSGKFVAVPLPKPPVATEPLATTAAPAP